MALRDSRPSGGGRSGREAARCTRTPSVALPTEGRRSQAKGGEAGRGPKLPLCYPGSMPTIDQIRSVLAEINDPEIHRSIVELNMVRGIELEGSRVTVDLALTIPGCPLKSFFQEVLPAKLKDHFPEITDVQINLGAMTEQERKSLVGGLRQEADIPLARADSSTTIIAVGSGKGGVGKSTTTV